MRRETTTMMGKITNRFITRWFDGRDELFIFIIFCISGVVFSFFGARLLNGFPYNSGKNTIGLLLPPLLCITYFTYSGYRYGFTVKSIIKTIILYGLLALPYAPLFLQYFQPTSDDDFSRYYLYAKNMVDNNTLWGGDKLFFKNVGNHYVTQPGYRYFIYLELLFFGNLYRFVQFFNMGIYILTIFFFQKMIAEQIREKKLQICLLLLVLLFSPYAIKNLLMGLPEWLTVLFLMWFCYLYLACNKRLTAVFLLGLVPFFRQNLLIATLLLFGWILMKNKPKGSLVILFLIPLLLPIYHNLYYAGDLRFFVDVFQLPFLNYNDGGQQSNGLNYPLIISNIIHYFGFDLVNGKVIFSFIAGLFLPFATILFFYFIKILSTKKHKILFFIICMSAIGPIILFGNAYYPRFEFVNVVVSLVAFLILSTYAKTKLNRKQSLRA
ncbi:hypothetical protein [Litoribaculum gwangyangense]|uniref:hypothetical protein n=1 Tax=Litoribaculum gwangyangense TaxID=1130722 RepID=UPI0031E92EE4